MQIETVVADVGNGLKMLDQNLGVIVVLRPQIDRELEEAEVDFSFGCGAHISNSVVGADIPAPVVRRTVELGFRVRISGLDYAKLALSDNK